MRFSTACWMVAGRASAEISASVEKLQAPVASRAMSPDSTRERMSSLVKNGLPSVASRSRCVSRSETFASPTTDSTRERYSEGENGGSVRETKRGSSAKESSMRISGCRLSVSVCR